MKLLESISQKLGIFIDPNVSFEKQVEDLNKAGQIDTKSLMKIMVAVVEYLIDQEK